MIHRLGAHGEERCCRNPAISLKPPALLDSLPPPSCFLAGCILACLSFSILFTMSYLVSLQWGLKEVCLQPHRAPVLVRVRPCGPCPGAQEGRQQGLVAPSCWSQQASAVCGRGAASPGQGAASPGPCDCRRGWRHHQGDSSHARRGQRLPQGPWAGKRGWPQASPRSCGHPVVALAVQSWSPGERGRAAPDPWWSSAELQEQLPTLEESLRWRGAQVCGGSPFLGSCFCTGVLCWGSCAAPHGGASLAWVDSASFLQVP